MVKIKDRRSNRQVIRSARQIQRDLLRCACLGSVYTSTITPWSGGNTLRPSDSWNTVGWDLPFTRASVVPLDFNLMPVVSNPAMNNITSVPYGFYRSFTRVFFNLKYQINGYDPYNSYQVTQDSPLRAKFFVFILTLRKKYAWACSAACYATDATGTENTLNYAHPIVSWILGSFCATEQVRNLYTTSTSAPYVCNLSGEQTEYAWNQNFKPKWLGKYFVIRKRYCVKLNYRKPDIRMKVLFNFKKHGLSYQNITLTQAFSGNSSFTTTTNLYATPFQQYWTYDMHIEKHPVMLFFPTGLQTRQTPSAAGSWTTAFTQREQLVVRMQMQHFFMVPPMQSIQAFNTTNPTISAYTDIANYEYNGVHFFQLVYNNCTGNISTNSDGSNSVSISTTVRSYWAYLVAAPSWATGRAYQNIMSTLTANVNEDDNLITDDTVTTDASVTYSASRNVASADDGGFDSVDGVDDGEPEQTTKSLVERLLKKVKV